MKKYILSLLVVSSLLFVASCTNGFDSLNTTTTALTKDDLSPALLFVSSVNAGTSADYQRNYSLYDDQYAHYFSNTVKTFKTGNYEYNDDWAVTGWSAFYASRLKEYNDINDICGTKDTYIDMKAINEIWNCFLWQRVTDRWGDVPYAGAAEGETVAFEAQKSIYLDLLSRLQTACESIGSSDADQYNPGEYDLLYGGDYAKWKKLGYSLMLRLAMRISNVDPTDAKTYSLLAIEGGTFTSNDDVAKVKLDMSGQGYYDYYNNILINWQSGVADLDFMNYMNGGTTGYLRADSADPRESIWFTPGDSGYVGFKNGMSPSSYPTDFAWSHYANINYTTTGYFYYSDDDVSGSRLYYPVMNYPEVLFLKAEAALRGWSGDAESLYSEGIQASMEEVASVAGVTIADSDIETYMNGLPSFSAASDKEAKLKLIITQKWLAIFPNSCEAWSEIRRTGYPNDLTYPDVSSSALVTDGNLIQRISYPINEYQYNESNMPDNYKSTSSYYSKREQYGVWWSLAGKDQIFSNGTTPSNSFN